MIGFNYGTIGRLKKNVLKDFYLRFYANSLNKEVTLIQVERWNGTIWSGIWSRGEFSFSGRKTKLIT